jgi:hypothetical protein
MPGRRAGFGDTTGSVGQDIYQGLKQANPQFDKTFVQANIKPYAGAGLDQNIADYQGKSDQQLLDIAAQAVLKLNKVGSGGTGTGTGDGGTGTGTGGTGTGNGGGNGTGTGGGGKGNGGGGKGNGGGGKKPPPKKPKFPKVPKTPKVPKNPKPKNPKPKVPKKPKYKPGDYTNKRPPGTIPGQARDPN